jgi:hypothetical protein
VRQATNLGDRIPSVIDENYWRVGGDPLNRESTLAASCDVIRVCSFLCASRMPPTLVHLSAFSQYPARRPLFDCSIYHFSETPTDLVVEGLFYAVSLHAFGMHQCIKLAFQQVPFIGRRRLSLHMTDVSSNDQREHAFIGGLCKSVLAALVPLRKNECPLWVISRHPHCTRACPLHPQ